MSPSTASDVVPLFQAKGRVLRLLALSALVSALGCSGAQDDELSLASVEQALEADAAVTIPDEQGVAGEEEDEGGGPGVVDAGGLRRDAGIGPRLDGGSFPGFPRDGGFSSGVIGHWTFDDCSASSPVLADSSGIGQNATRSAGVQCVAGQSGQAVAFDERRDIVEALASSSSTFSTGMTVTAWVNPRARQGSIVSKQTQGGNVFELTLNRSGVTFSVALRDGYRTRRVSSTAPITLNRWTHVAGAFDGEFVRLFRDGRQVGQVAASGLLADLNGSISMGSNARAQVLSGALDEVMLFDRALQEFEVGQLSCIRRPATFTVTPASAGPVQPDVSVSYDVAITNHSAGTCGTPGFFLFSGAVEPGISVLGPPQQPVVIDPGQTGHLSLTVTGSTDADPGTYQIPFQIFDFSSTTLSASVEFVLAAPTGCFVRTGRELMIRDLSVVEDPIRTGFDGPAEDPRRGLWTFARLMQDMAPTPEQAPAMVEQLFTNWLSNQTINTFSVPSRRSMSELVLDAWPRTTAGALDLTRAPVRLLAIVNRLDVRNLDKGHAGEGRFVFGVLDPDGFPMEFTIIFEYRLPATTTADVVAWAEAWHALGQLPFPSEEYNAALASLTGRFAGRGAEPGRPNGSALGQLRTNEIALNSPWELREFKLSAATGMLMPSTVELTPDTSFMADSRLVADYVNQNEAAILIERHEVPELFQGTPFLGGSSFNDLFAWRATGINNPEARHRFSLNTCNGCHSSEETGTGFLHIFPRFPGEVAQVSGFLSGTSVGDPVTGSLRTFHDLGRRNADLKAVVCGGTASTVTTPLPSSASAPARAALGARATAGGASATREQFLGRGIGRVH